MDPETPAPSPSYEARLSAVESRLAIDELTLAGLAKLLMVVMKEQGFEFTFAEPGKNRGN